MVCVKSAHALSHETFGYIHLVLRRYDWGNLADERSQVFLPLPKGEGWGEGEER